MSERLTISVREAAERLGLSVWTTRKYIREGVLPSIRLGNEKGGRILVPVAALEETIAQRAAS